MNIAGTFDPYAKAFPTDLLPEIFTVVLEEWPNSPRPAGNPLENRITNRFVGHLERVMRKKQRPSFHFTPRRKLPDSNADSESGEIDIYIRSFPQHPDAYFSFECKRLNVQYDSGFRDEASKYVGESGMGCFISGQYPTTCDCSGMIGYVMDGNVPKTIAAININLVTCKTQLRLHPPHRLEQAAILPGNDQVLQTVHSNKQHNILIYHIFLPF